MSSSSALNAPLGKWRNICFLSIGQVLAMSVWFSASAVTPQLMDAWSLTRAEGAWMTMSVQIGFVVGALISATANLPDRISNTTLIVTSTVLAAASNAFIPVFAGGPASALVARFVTGAALAGVYPPGMKVVASWTREDRGLGIGLLVGAITLGSASPHLVSALQSAGEVGIPDWKVVLGITSGLCLLGGIVVRALVKDGPYLSETAPFDWKYIWTSLGDRPVRLANFGYLGHMWELYAMWVWVPALLIASYESAGWSLSNARLAGFSVIAAGGLGSIWAGLVADRRGRTMVTTASLLVSGCCCLLVGLFFSSPLWLTFLCLLWGAAVVADSAQFSTAVSELSDQRYVGTALTLQTSMGFALTLISIRIVPPMIDLVGWRWALGILVLGPMFGIRAMRALRRLPESKKMASGNR